MSFNLDLSKMAKEDLFSRKKIERFHHNLTFIGKSVHSSPFQKHLGLMLDSKLNFDMHLKEKISIVNNALLRKLRNFHSIRYFLGRHLDYCDVIYDKMRCEKFIENQESIEYNATLATSGASKEKLYNKLDLEYFRDRRWIRRLCLFHKIFNLKSPKCHYDLIPPITRSYATRNDKNRLFFPKVINEWHKLDIKITNITSHNTFLKILYKVSFDRYIFIHLESTILLGCNC